MADEINNSQVLSSLPEFGGTKLAKSAVAITFFSGFGFLLALAFQIVLAKNFGASKLTDAYIGASTFPLMLIGIFTSILNKTFIPVFFDIRSKKNAWHSVSNILNGYFLFLCGLVLVGYLLSPALIKITLPGLGGESYFLSLKILRVLMIMIIFGALAGLLSSIHYTQENFILPSIAPNLKWLAILLTIFFLSKKFGILSVPIGMVIGYGIQFLILLPEILKSKRLSFAFNLKDPVLLSMLFLMLPLFMSHIFNNISIFFMRGIASKMSEGTISCLDYASKIKDIVILFSVQGVAVTTFPLFSKLSSENNMKKLKEVFIIGQRLIFMIILPLIIGIILFRIPIIRILFERGAFDAVATFRTANLLFAFSGAFLGLAIGTVQSQMYYALKNTKRVMKITFLQMALFLAMVFFAKNYFAEYGIALAFSIAIFIGCCINYYHINKILNISSTAGDFLFISKIIVTSAVMALIVYSTFNLLSNFINNLIANLAVNAVLGIIVYFLILKFVFRIPELRLAFSLITDKLFGRSKNFSLIR